MFIKIISKGGEPSDFISIKALAKKIHTDEKEKIDKSINQVHYSLRTVSGEGETGLDYCHPFPDSDVLEDEQSGPKFIVFNVKCEEFVKGFVGGGKSPEEVTPPTKTESTDGE